MATHSSVLAWRIPGTGEPGGLPSIGLQSRTQLKRLSSSLHITKNHRIYRPWNSPDQNTGVVAAAKSLQSCPTLCDPIDGSPPGSPVPGDSPGKNTGVGCHFLLQCMKVKSLSRVRLFVTPWTVAYQAPPSMEFSTLEYWSRLSLPSIRNSLSRLNQEEIRNLKW